MFGKDYVGEDTPQALARRRGSDCIQTGLMAQAAGLFVTIAVGDPAVPAFWMGLMMLLVSVPLLLIGCYRRARIKGYGAGYAALGLIGLPGVLLLISLPDRHRQRPGFQVVMPLKVSTTWVPPDEDPRHRPRSWGEESLRHTQ
jgi:hypothetical protein